MSYQLCTISITFYLFADPIPVKVSRSQTGRMWTVVVAILVILVVLCIKASIRPSNFPPGPPCLAFAGSLPYLEVRRVQLDQESDLFVFSRCET